MGPNNRSVESDNAHLESHKDHVDHSTWEDNQTKKIFSDKSRNIEGDQIGGTVREVNNFKNGGNLCFGATCLELQDLNMFTDAAKKAGGAIKTGAKNTVNFSKKNAGALGGIGLSAAGTTAAVMTGNVPGAIIGGAKTGAAIGGLIKNHKVVLLLI